jgi:hypothetical protein
LVHPISIKHPARPHTCPQCQCLVVPTHMSARYRLACHERFGTKDHTVDASEGAEASGWDTMDTSSKYFRDPSIQTGAGGCHRVPCCAMTWFCQGTVDPDANFGPTEMAPLIAVLGHVECCQACGADSEMSFSFCLNRVVSSDRVQHCTDCGKCFYFRPGCMGGCQHCACEEQCSDGFKQVDEFEEGLSSEGFWGY